jgi:hypothetical protein
MAKQKQKTAVDFLHQSTTSVYTSKALPIILYCSMSLCPNMWCHLDLCQQIYFNLYDPSKVVTCVCKMIHLTTFAKVNPQFLTDNNH